MTSNLVVYDLRLVMFKIACTTRRWTCR